MVDIVVGIKMNEKFPFKVVLKFVVEATVPSQIGKV